MNELIPDQIDPFENRLARLVRSYTDASETVVDAGAVARRVAVPRRDWALRLEVPRLRWLLLIGLLGVVIALAVAIGAGTWHPTGVPILVSANGQVIEIDPDSSQQRSLGSGDSPIWSPDRSRVAFNGADAAWVMNADGSNRQALLRLAADGYFSGPPVWTADGRQVLVAAQDLTLVDVATGAARPVGLSTWKDGGTGAISPDGLRIALVQQDGLVVTAVPANVNARTVVRTSETLPWLPRWSPDGAQLAYSDGPGIHVVSANLSNDRIVIDPVMSRDVDSMAWSPDGTHIAFTERLIGAFIVDIASGASVRAWSVQAPGAVTAIAWSRDGRSVAMAVNDAVDSGPGSVSIWIVRADGDGLRRLLSGADPNWDRGVDWW